MIRFLGVLFLTALVSVHSAQAAEAGTALLEVQCKPVSIDEPELQKGDVAAVKIKVFVKTGQVGVIQRQDLPSSIDVLNSTGKTIMRLTENSISFGSKVAVPVRVSIRDPQDPEQTTLADLNLSSSDYSDISEEEQEVFAVNLKEYRDGSLSSAGLGGHVTVHKAHFKNGRGVGDSIFFAGNVVCTKNLQLP